MANPIMYVPPIFRKALDLYAESHGVRLAAMLHELVPFVEIAANRAAAKVEAPPPEPELPPMAKPAEVGEAS